MLVSVFMDNTNILIEGKKTVGAIEGGAKADVKYRYNRNSYISELHLDHGRLLSTVLNGRKMGSDPVIVGSRPSNDDDIWLQAQGNGFTVDVYDQRCTVELLVAGLMVIHEKDPGIFVLIASNRDYEPLIRKALRLKWNVEIWFWSRGI
jgi:hypothetical protein